LTHQWSEPKYFWGAFQDEDDEGPKFKDILCDFLKKSMDVLCIWDCCKLWIRTAEVSFDLESILDFSFIYFCPE
jgi:hypothetical protein